MVDYEKVDFIGLIEHKIREGHGTVDGLVPVLGIISIKRHNEDLYEHFKGLNVHQIEVQLHNQEGRLYAWYLAGIISSAQHNKMLNEARIKAISAARLSVIREARFKENSEIKTKPTIFNLFRLNVPQRLFGKIFKR